MVNMEGRNPITALNIKPRFKSVAKFPQQCLRYDSPRFALDDENGYIGDENIELFLSSLQGLEDDYGSYAPVTPVNASENTISPGVSGATSWKISHKHEQVLSPSDSDTSESDEVVKRSGPAITRRNCILKMGPEQVSTIAKSLAQRIEVVSESGLSPRSCFSDSPSCNSDAETEVRNNLTSRFDIIEASSLEAEMAEIEVLNLVASTFVGKEEGTDFCDTNSFCEVDESESDVEIRMRKPKLFITGKQIEGEIELLYSAAASMKEFDASAAVSSQADSSISSSSHSSNTSESSNSSNTSQGILLPPKRAIGYDPFGRNSDFSIPGSILGGQQRRVHFEGIAKLSVHENALDRLIKAQASGAIPSDGSDDSSTSLEYLLSWCGVPGDFMDV